MHNNILFLAKFEFNFLLSKNIEESQILMIRMIAYLAIVSLSSFPWRSVRKLPRDPTRSTHTTWSNLEERNSVVLEAWRATKRAPIRQSQRYHHAAFAVAVEAISLCFFLRPQEAHKLISNKGPLNPDKIQCTLRWWARSSQKNSYLSYTLANEAGSLIAVTNLEQAASCSAISNCRFCKIIIKM